MCHDVRIPIPIPWCPYPTPCLSTYIHVYIIVYVCDDVCVYLIVFVFALFSLLLSLSLLLFSFFFFSCSLLACGKACPWAEAAGLISLVYASVLFYLIIIHQYTCIVCVYVPLCIVQCMCIHHVLCMYPTDVCMYIVQCVLCCVHAALCIHSSIHTVLCSTDYLCMVCHSVQPVCITYMLCIACYLFFSMFVYNKKALCIIHNAYLKLILVSNIFYLFWRARKMRGHPVASQNSGNTFVMCFSDIFETKKSSRVSEIVL